MKRIIYAAIALLALVSCSKEPENQDPVKKEDPTEKTAFVKGQEVIITCGQDQTKVSGETDGLGGYKFKWEEGDKILVSAGSPAEYALFDMISEPGSSTATFKGFMPGDGTTFSVQYPVDDPVLTNQTYTAGNAFDYDKMKFSATGCTLGTDVTLVGAYSVLRLNLYGAFVTVNSIKVTMNKKNYTLDCGDGVVIGEESSVATPFNIVVPAGNQAFTVDISSAYSGSLIEYGTVGTGTPITASYFSATANEFIGGRIKDMPAKNLSTVVWAPVNCGYNNGNVYGKYYQFGRSKGFGYYDKDTANQPKFKGASWTSGYNKAPSGTYHYLCGDPDVKSDSPWDWYTKTGTQLSKWPRTAPSGTTGISDPCPAGWRIPTSSEYNALLGGNTKPAKVKNTKYGTTWGIYLNGKPSASASSDPVVYLPIAGYVSLKEDNFDDVTYKRNYSLNYWASDVSGINGKSLWLIFNSDSETYRQVLQVASHKRGYGFTIRCVQDGAGVMSGDFDSRETW